MDCMASTRRNVVALALEAAGFTLAGGLWGDAAWLRVDAETVANITGMDTQTVPTDADSPCWVTVYRAPFRPGWTLHDGDAPMGRFESQDWLVQHMAVIDCANLESALILLRQMGARPQ